MSAELLSDAGPCRMSGCGDPQWSHKRGKFGCKEVGCGRYLPPAGVVESDPASPVPGVLVERPDGADPGQPVGAFEPAEPADVDLPVVEFARPLGFASDIEQPERDRLAGRRLTDPVETLDVKRRRRREPSGPVVESDPAAQAESLRQVAEVDVQLAEPEGDEQPAAKPPMPPADFLAAHTMVGERAAAGAGWQAGYLAGQAAAAGLEAELTEALRELGRERGRLRTARWRIGDLERHVARMVEHFDTAAAAGPARVLFQYDADHCRTCGFRTTVPGLAHHHPLTPVTVLVVERATTAEADAEATNPTKE